MSKPMKMTEDMIRECLPEIEKKLREMTLFGGKGVYNIDYEYSDKVTARVTFTQKAVEKQERLIAGFESEVGWHGVCKRDPEDAAHFIVEDIIVFPQEVTGTTVTPDQKDYDMWLMTLPDEQFKNCRYHGHSHVNMNTCPSGTDDKFQKDILGRLDGDGYNEEERQKLVEKLGDTDFYIFMIWNKRGEFNVRIYDMWSNTFYEGKEITVDYQLPEDPLADFMADAKAKVKPHTYTTAGYSGSRWGVTSQIQGGAAPTAQRSLADYPEEYEIPAWYRGGWMRD